LSRHVHVIITQASHWSAACCPATCYKHLPYCCMTSPAHALYSITSHVHAQTRRKRFHCIVASSCWGSAWPLFRNALSKFVTLYTSINCYICILLRIHCKVTFRNKLIFLRWGVVSTTPNLQAGGSPLFGCPRLLIQHIFSATLHIWRPSPSSATWGRAMLWWQGTHLTWMGWYGLDRSGSG
jgi:hypothetical protein